MEESPPFRRCPKKFKNEFGSAVHCRKNANVPHKWHADGRGFSWTSKNDWRRRGIEEK